MRFKAILFRMICVLAPSAVAFAQDSDPIASSASRLAQSIRQARFERIGVLPWLFKEDQFNFYGSDPPPAALDSSLHTRMYVEQMQNQLAEQGGGAIRLVDAFTIGDALRGAGVDPAKFKPQDPALKKLPELVDGGIDGVIVGTVRERALEEGSEYRVRDVAWKLLDAKDLSMVAAPQATTAYSLADLVYDGRSQEFFRWNDGRLWAVGFSPQDADTSKLHLNPSDSIELFGIYPGAGSQINPVFNPNCPFKIRFMVEGEERKLSVPIAKEPNEVLGGEQGQRWAWADAAYLTLNPGESFFVETLNQSAQQALVAVFVDGINTLGKRREIPNQTCRAWSLKAGAVGRFRGWFSGEKGKEVLEEFVITPYSDSVAGKLGEKTQMGAITLVFFSVGWPNRGSLAMTERPYLIQAHWDENAKKLVIDEGMAPEEPTGDEGMIAGAMPDTFAVGGKKPQSHPLAYNQMAPQGVILTAMTVHYGSDEDIANYVGAGGSNWQTSLEAPPEGSASTNFELVEASTNGHKD